ncbi:MAG TPA: hypothetical protein VHH73_16305 [Verrucomicrobiae bacterium]|nr:hypothetical protein [Verrucomicrobiae bacterium]
MSNTIRILLYVLFVTVACALGYRFYENYTGSAATATANSAKKNSTDLTDVNVPGSARGARSSGENLGLLGAGIFLTVVGLGLLIGYDVSRYMAGRAVKFLYNDEGEGVANPEYEQAEQEWANGNHLEAIRLMREYLLKNPREQHVALRIAEIYEKDLQNYLASALEYEEVLKQKLPPERWGWAAIHLCNLYFSKLDQHEKGVALLKRIDSEYGNTAAAEKARKRLALLESGGEMEMAEEPPAS